MRYSHLVALARLAELYLQEGIERWRGVFF